MGEAKKALLTLVVIVILGGLVTQATYKITHHNMTCPMSHRFIPFSQIR